MIRGHSKLWNVKIGLEIHAQIQTASKLFSAAPAATKGEMPNTCVSLFDAAQPGTLPRLNRLELFVSFFVPQTFHFFGTALAQHNTMIPVILYSMFMLVAIQAFMLALNVFTVLLHCTCLPSSLQPCTYQACCQPGHSGSHCF